MASTRHSRSAFMTSSRATVPVDRPAWKLCQSTQIPGVSPVTHSCFHPSPLRRNRRPSPLNSHLRLAPSNPTVPPALNAISCLSRGSYTKYFVAREHPAASSRTALPVLSRGYPFKGPATRREGEGWSWRPGRTRSNG